MRKNNNKDENNIGITLPLGLCFGLVYGMLMNNLALGISLGLCFGIVVGASTKRK